MLLSKRFVLQCLSAVGLGERRCLCCGEPSKVQHFFLKGVAFDLALCDLCRSLLPCFHDFFEYELNGSDWCLTEKNIKPEKYDAKKNCASCFLPFFNNEHAMFSDGEEYKCLYCITKNTCWRDIYCYGEYTKTLRNLLLSAKFSNNLSALHLVGLLLAEAVLIKHQHKFGDKKFDWDFITAVPLHPKRLQKRGFNQSLELAKQLGKLFKLPVEQKALKRIVFTTPQAGLSQKQRRLNLVGSIQAGTLTSKKFINNFQGLTVLLVDDIFTTGTTLEHSAKALLEAGVKAVDIAVVAKTSMLSVKP
ncbi:ComF family protein [Desulfovibrio litoralis]|uniref:ComF family protein n=1 Tax=Desulfovibrio litoralis DSM 11393 TaxID=1121455 RepID=A0A1M7SCF3_9BACT|nr:phosphoribosyltransferase family protein [Desulfovibrio litoralis]SHN56144.1 comF family protein [Desulfovibrio litoralis DSM 11393]